MPRPTDAQCAQLRAQLLQQGDGTDSLVRQRFPIEEDRLHYWKWVSAQAAAKRQRPPKLPHNELARNISLANLFNPRNISNLLTLLVSPQLRPMPLGHSAAGNKYRLVAHPLELSPHEKDQLTDPKLEACPAPNPGTLLCLRSRNEPYIEGTPPVFGRHHSARRVSSSTRVTRAESGQSVISIPGSDSGYGSSSSSSSGSHSYNFIFHQLGPIERHPPHAGNPDEDSHGWEPTGFVLVVGADSNGHPKNLCAVLDLFPLADSHNDPETRVDVPMSNLCRAEACNFLAGTTSAFSCARLDGVSGLGGCEEDFRTRLQWTDMIEGAIDLLDVTLPGA